MVYFVFVAPMKKISDMAAKKKVPVKADPTEVELLIQIRNLLRDQNATADTSTGATGPATGPTTAPGTGS